MGIQGNFFNLIETSTKNRTTNIVFNGKRLLQTRQRHPFSPFLFSIPLEVLVNAIKQEKEIKGIQIRNEEI